MKRAPFFAPGTVQHFRRPPNRLRSLRRILLATALAAVLLLVTCTPVVSVWLALGLQALGRAL